MAFSRRQFLRRTMGTGIMLGLGGLPLVAREFAQRSFAARPLMKSPVGFPLRMLDRFSSSTIVARSAQQQIWPDAPTQIWGFNGTFPGPTIRAQKGATFKVTLSNQLTQETIIHWHGLTLPSSMDGHPKDAIAPGATYDYAFTVAQRAGTYWYHPHPDMKTGEQVYRGMSGLFIVEDPEEQALTLPRGKYDVPIIMHDRRSTFNRQLDYLLGDQDMLEGLIGDTVLANGTPNAYFEVDRGLYRFRVLNASNARILKLALSDNSVFHLIGTDGGLLDKPVEVTTLMLAPAERAELLVDFSSYAAGTSVTLKSAMFFDLGGGHQGAETDLLRFDVTEAAGVPMSIPTTLAQLEALDATAAQHTRSFEFRSDSGSPPMHLINGKMFEMTRVDLQVLPGDLEIWNFINRSQFPHPVHMHGGQFQVVSVASDTHLAPEYLGWKDTVLVQPYQTVSVVVRIPEFLGLFLLHCHNLEHEDHGMMMNFEVVTTTGVDTAPEPPKEMNLSERDSMPPGNQG